MIKERFKQFYKNFKKFNRTLSTYTLKKYNLVEILIIWSKRQLSRFQFLVLSGIIVGALGGLAGITLKTVVHYIQQFLSNNLPFTQKIVAHAIFPLIGILLTTLVARYFYKSKKEVKLSQVLNDIAQNDSVVEKQETHSQLIQSAITVGFGGSAGLETPMAITGAAIGSNFAQRYRLGYKEKTLLLAGGAAAGIAAAFNAPIAGIMFAFELLLTGIVFSDFIPLVIASICGSLLAKIVLNDDILFSLSARDPFDYMNTVYYLALGIIAGFYARYFIVINEKVKHYFDRFPHGSIKKALSGGTLLSLLCVAFPALFGEGYLNIKMLHQGEIQYLVYNEVIDFFNFPNVTIIVMLTLTLMLKAIATSITLNSGGVGGNFAPSLIAGGLLGYLFGFILSIIGFQDVPITNLMLVGMAGVLSGVLYAPLTAIFLIAESSSGYDLFIPLMIVAVIAFLINKYFSPINPELTKLAEEGKIFTTRHDQNILTQIRITECLDEDGIRVDSKADLTTINDLFKNSNKAILAVVDVEGLFWGMINKEQMSKVHLKGEGYESLLASDIAINPSNLVFIHENIESVVRKFEESDTWYLPLVNSEHKYLGFVSRFKVLKRYRQLLKGLS